MKVEDLLYAGNNLGKAQAIFAAAVKHRPLYLSIRQGIRLLQLGRQEDPDFTIKTMVI